MFHLEEIMHRTRKTKSEAVMPAPMKIAKPRAPRRTPVTVTSKVFDPAAYQEEIAEAAYYVWLARGNAPGSAADDWSQAESIVRERYQAKKRALAATSV